MVKRGYSREFTPKTDRRVRFEVDRIPPTLYDAVVAKARREGVSLRALTLRLWKEWDCPAVNKKDPVCGEDHIVGDMPRECFACLDHHFEQVQKQRDALYEVARIEQALQMRGYTLATAKDLGDGATDAYRCAGSTGLNNWRRMKREAAIALVEGK